MNDKSMQQVQSPRQMSRAVAAAAVIAAILAVGAGAFAGAGTLQGPAGTSTSTTPQGGDPRLGPQTPQAASTGPQVTAKVESAGGVLNVPPPVSPPVPLNATVTLARGGKVKLSAIEIVQGEARGPGEVAGPSLKFQVTIDNPTGTAISTSNMLVNLESGSEKKPALQLSGPGVVHFPESVEPGTSASAVYVFNVAPADRDRIRILFDYGLTDPIAVFEGSAGKPGA